MSQTYTVNNIIYTIDVINATVVGCDKQPTTATATTSNEPTIFNLTIPSIVNISGINYNVITIGTSASLIEQI